MGIYYYVDVLLIEEFVPLGSNRERVCCLYVSDFKLPISFQRNKLFGSRFLTKNNAGFTFNLKGNQRIY